jgi:hypothetical protein
MNDEDRKWLQSLPKERLADLFSIQISNIWRVDGLYFLGVEENFGTDAATNIDVNCWNALAKSEARDLKEVLKPKTADLKSFVAALKATSWALYLDEKEWKVNSDRAVFRVTSCRTQNTRMKKGVGEFPCKEVRWTYLKEFAKVFNPKIEVNCIVCPPDEHDSNLWCEWEFVLKSK